MSPPIIEAVLFDGSGVLFDDKEVVYRITQRILEDLHLPPVSMEEFAETVMPFWRLYVRLGMSQDEATDKPSKLFKKYYPLLYHEVKPLPDVRRVLSELKGCGLKVGVVSQAPSSFLHRHLKDLGVLQLLDVVVAQEDCPEQKPSPMPILLAQSRLDCTKVAYVGDMRQDIMAGREARVITVALCWPASYHTREIVKLENPDYVITDIVDLLKLFCKA